MHVRTSPRPLYVDVSDLLVDEPSCSQTVPAGCNTSASYLETIYCLNTEQQWN